VRHTDALSSVLSRSQNTTPGAEPSQEARHSARGEAANVRLTGLALSQNTDIDTIDWETLHDAGLPDHRREEVALMRRIDAMSDEGSVRHGTPAHTRNEAQRTVIQSAWLPLFGAPTLSDAEASTVLSLMRETATGLEGEFALNLMYTVADAPRERELKAPRAVYVASALNACKPSEAALVRLARRQDQAMQAQERARKRKAKDAKAKQAEQEA
jgi:hypothetical protein